MFRGNHISQEKYKVKFEETIKNMKKDVLKK